MVIDRTRSSASIARILATALIRVLARRGARISAALRAEGREPLEVYPYATLRLLGLPCRGKKTPAGRRRIHRALKNKLHFHRKSCIDDGFLVTSQ